MSCSARKIVGLVIVMLAFSLACSCDVASLLGSETPTTTRQQRSGVLFEDDFSDDGSGWEIGEWSSGSINGAVGYGRGYYFVLAEAESVMWGVAFESFHDLVIEVEATQTAAGPTDNNAYGVGCRVQEDGLGYFLYISGDGGYAIVLDTEDGRDYLAQWAPSAVVRQGNATNTIRAVCDGSTLMLFVNGERLATAQDDTYTHGDIAFAADNYESGVTEIHFDNLVVSEP